MKKTLLLAIVCLQLLYVENAYSQIKKAAVISIFGNKNLSDNPLDTKIYKALLEDESFDISGTVADFEKVIQEKMVPSFTFPFMTKEEVVSNEDYQNLDTWLRTDEEGEDLANFLNPYVPAEGYKNIQAFAAFTNKKAIKRCFEIFPDVDAVLVAYIDYNLYDNVGAMGITTKKVYAYCNIKLFDKEAKRIFKLKERASSKKGVVAVGGLVVDPEKLKPMVYDASKKLLVEVEGSILKSLKKMAKKLN